MSEHLDPESFALGVLYGLLLSAALVRIVGHLHTRATPPRPPTDPAEALKWEVWAAAEHITRQEVDGATG